MRRARGSFLFLRTVIFPSRSSPGWRDDRVTDRKTKRPKRQPPAWHEQILIIQKRVPQEVWNSDDRKSKADHHLGQNIKKKQTEMQTPVTINWMKQSTFLVFGDMLRKRTERNATNGPFWFSTLFSVCEDGSWEEGYTCRSGPDGGGSFTRALLSCSRHVQRGWGTMTIITAENHFD